RRATRTDVRERHLPRHPRKTARHNARDGRRPRRGAGHPDHRVRRLAARRDGPRREGRAHPYARPQQIVPIEDVLPQVETRMRKAIDALKHELASVRTGRAAPSPVEELDVAAYGAATPIVSLAAISAPEARQIVIQPWDRNLIKAIEKAIIASDLGLTPSNDGA